MMMFLLGVLTVVAIEAVPAYLLYRWMKKTQAVGTWRHLCANGHDAVATDSYPCPACELRAERREFSFRWTKMRENIVAHENREREALALLREAIDCPFESDPAKWEAWCADWRPRAELWAKGARQ